MPQSPPNENSPNYRYEYTINGQTYTCLGKETGNQTGKLYNRYDTQPGSKEFFHWLSAFFLALPLNIRVILANAGFIHSILISNTLTQEVETNQRPALPSRSDLIVTINGRHYQETASGVIEVEASPAELAEATHIEIIR